MASRMDGPILHSDAAVGVLAPLVDRLATALTEGDSALVTCAADLSPLLAAAARHPCLARARAFRVRPPLDLIAMLRQVTGGDGPADATLEQGFDALTAPDAGCDRIVLLVGEAHLLPHPTLRYIEFALRAGPHLQVVLAGQPGIADMLALDGFARLRDRIPLHLALPDPGPRWAGPLVADPLPGEPDPVVPYRMTPPRLLACAAGAAGLAIAGMISLTPPAPRAALALAGPGVAPPAVVEPTSEPINSQAALTPLAHPLPEPDVSVAIADPGPDAEQRSPGPPSEAGPALVAASSSALMVAASALDPPLAFAPASTPEAADQPPGPSSEAGPALATDPPSAPMVAASALDPPPAPAPASTPEAANRRSGPPSEAGPALAAEVPAAPRTAPPGTPDLPPAPASELPSEVAEAAPLTGALSAAASEPPADSPGQAEVPDPLPAPATEAPLTGAPTAGPDRSSSRATALPPAAHLTVTMPAARQARAAVPLSPPATPRTPAHSAAIRPERVADQFSVPGGDGQRCRGIILRVQLGESPTDGDRMYLRNGCR